MKQFIGHNIHHPELRPGEVFISNIDLTPIVEGMIPDDQTLPFQTRRGVRAYAEDGALLSSNHIPIFAQKEDLLAQGLDPEDPLGVFKALEELGVSD